MLRPRAAPGFARRRGSREAALVAAALALAPVAHSFWLGLARVDGLLVALWLWAAVALLPETLERGSETLSWPRVWAGGALLALAALAKPTAAVVGAPLVLGWLLVDRRSALRAAVATLALGGAALGALLALTHGGFWWSLRLQLLHARVPGQTARLVGGALLRHGATLVAGLTAAALLGRRGRGWRDGAVLLWLAGPLSVPLLSKSGAIFVYLLPWAAGQAVLVGRLCGRLGARGLALGAAAIAALLALQRYPTPTAEDQRTAQAFYGYIAARGAPLLAANPDYAYYLVGEPVRIEGSSFPFLMRHRMPGVAGVLADLDAGRFRTVVEKTRAGRLRTPAYSPVGACDVGFFNGPMRFTLLVPAAEAAGAPFAAPADTRCRADDGVAR